MPLLCYTLFLFYKLLNMFRATMCPSSGADDCVMLSPRVGIVPWHYVLRPPQRTHYLLTGSDSLPAATAQYQHAVITLHSCQLLKMGTWLPETCWATCKGEIKDNTWMTSSWFLIHTDALSCSLLPWVLFNQHDSTAIQILQSSL